jgi:hypothetical protein
VDVMVFIFVLGGMIGVINRTGSFNAGLMALARRTKGNEFMIVFSVSVLMVLGGTTCGRFFDYTLGEIRQFNFDIEIIEGFFSGRISFVLLAVGFYHKYFIGHIISQFRI